MDSAQSLQDSAAHMQLPNYRVLSVLGRGAFGSVWKCMLEQGSSNAENYCAIKQIDLRCTSLKYLHGEIVSMKVLSQRCRNVVGLHNYEFTNTHAYLIMEYCDGGDLRRYLDKNITLSELHMNATFRQIGSALSFIHNEGIMHRDIKPGNILFCKNRSAGAPLDLVDCVAKLGDFGIAAMSDCANAPDYGTPDYMAPEVIQTLVYERNRMHGSTWRKLFPLAKPSYNAKCDIFSLGVVMYECATGRVPFERATNLLVQDTSVLSSIASSQPYCSPDKCSPELCDLLQNLLAANPSKRLSADNLLDHPWFGLLTMLAEEPFIVAMFGAPGSGKRTSLTKRLATKQDERRVAMRAEVNVGPFAVSFEVADMSHLGEISRAYLHGVDAVIVVYDTTNDGSLLVAKQWLRMVKHASVIALVGTKTDLCTNREVFFEEADVLAQECATFHLQTSAKTNMNVQSLLRQLGEFLLLHKNCK